MYNVFKKKYSGAFKRKRSKLVKEIIQKISHKSVAIDSDVPNTIVEVPNTSPVSETHNASTNEVQSINSTTEAFDASVNEAQNTGSIFINTDSANEYNNSDPECVVEVNIENEDEKKEALVNFRSTNSNSDLLLLRGLLIMASNMNS